MLPLVAGGLISLAGTAASMYGQHQKDKATGKSLKKSRRAAAQHAGEERSALMQEQGLLSGLARERQGNVGEYIGELGAAEMPGSDEGFGGRQTGILNDIRTLTPNAEGLYTGAPATQAQTGQAVQTGQDNKAIAEQMMAEYTDRSIQERQQAAGHKLTLADLLRASRGKGALQRMQLAKALRDLDYQRKTGAMQSALDSATRKGDTLNLLGGLATRIGGMGMSYGAETAQPETEGTVV